MRQLRSRQRALESFAQSQFSKRVREGGIIAVMAIALFILLALITYHRADPGWSTIGNVRHVSNAAGIIGSWIADVLLYVFGYFAYLFPFMVAYAGWLALHPRDDDDEYIFDPWYLTFRVLGFMLILLSGSTLASMHFAPNTSHLPYAAGGIIGSMVGPLMLREFNFVGSTVVLLAILLAGITLFTGLSWVAVADRVGYFVWSFAGRAFSGVVCIIQDLIGRAQEEEVPKHREPKVTLRQKGTPEAKPKPSDKPVISRPNIVEPSLRSEQDRQQPLFDEELVGGMPSLSLLDVEAKPTSQAVTNRQLEEKSRDVEIKLADFGVAAQVVAVHPGPVVTRFELDLAAGTKVSRITGLVKDLARSLSVISVRVVEVIPGKSCIGLELPNQNREIVRLRETLASQQYGQSRSPLSLALGKDIGGHPVVVNLAKMPHLLVAGTTGSGKSVCLNAMLLSLLYKATPSELRLILIDPKMLELSFYEDIPHLLAPVVTDMKEAANALRWCVAEMERRYRLMASLGVRNLSGYNHKIEEARKKGAPLLDQFWDPESGEGPDELQTFPYIVVLIDEFADMMMVVGKKVEELIARIAQKARAAGIHLILATQRPSVDVITGLIKANIPTRIAFQASSRIDSRTILDQMGAEQLLGYGDMLYLPPGSGHPIRVHGAFVSDDEVHNVVKDLKRRGKPEYHDDILDGSVGGIPGIDPETPQEGEEDAEADPLYDQAVKIVTETRRASISNVQRRLKIGYNRAARIVEAMEEAGVVSPMESNGTREVIAPPPVE